MRHTGRTGTADRFTWFHLYSGFTRETVQMANERTSGRARPQRRRAPVAVAVAGSLFLISAGTSYGLSTATRPGGTASTIVTIPAPPSLVENQVESDTEVRHIVERTKVTLAKAVAVDRLASSAAGAAGVLPVGRVVSSHLLHVDP